MFVTKVEAIIHRKLEDVFSYVANLETMVSYNSSIKNATWEDPEKKNCKITLNLSFIDIKGNYQIKEYLPQKKIIAECSVASLEFTDTYLFSEVEGKCHLVIEDRMTLKGLLALSEGILKPILQKEMQSNLNRLVSILEEKK
ncbi:MAG: polyketide cyclase/dehydrase and lipid transport [Leptospiraceae bacterium]|nr:polyketide cyclase/dehydrase and lipid transport [Leptospiraceae bacterium]